MTYSDLDPALYAWAARHGLHVFTKDRDYDTRSVLIVDDVGDTYSLFAAPTGADRVGVSVYVRGRSERSVSATDRDLVYSRESPLDQFDEALESCYSVVESWIRAEGHTRTPA